VVPRDALDVLEKRKSLVLAENRTPIVPTRSLVTTVTELPRIPPRRRALQKV
jgi:hypothetical protein